uniref:ZP domain-containing protein n=2 Tax=Monopterus albus TaxID=43700 RepID=A0A3Q3IJA1_MONAL
MSPSLTPMIFSTFSTTHFSHITPLTSDPPLTTVPTTPGRTTVIISTSEMVSTTAASTTLVSTTSPVTVLAVSGVSVVATAQTMTMPTTATVPTTTTNPTTTSTDSSTSTTTHTPTTTTPMTSVTSTPPVTVTIPATTATASTTNFIAPRTVNSASGAISVQCRTAVIFVTVARNFLLNTKIRESALYLGLQECGVNGGNDTHAQLTAGWDECDTRLVQNETYYTASVTLFNTMDPYTSPNGTVEVPRIQLEVPIMCTFLKSMVLSANSGSSGYETFKDAVEGSGSFHVTVQLMNGTIPLPHNYSMSSREVVVVEASLNTSSKKINVIMNKCWVTPTPNPTDTPSYTFLENSCPLNSYTEVLMNGNSSKSRVSVQIFAFVNLDMIYVHCQVHICLESGLDTCVPTCRQRSARASNRIGTAIGTSGPVFKANDDENLDQGLNYLQIVGFACLGVGLSIFFIVGFVCLYYQRNRIGHYNFNINPKQENFTYLVFNA